jgi:hypothetical protein
VNVTLTGPGNPSPGGPPATATVKVLSKVVRGASFLIAVRVPGKGRITITGGGIRTVRRAVAKAGRYRLRVTLTSREKRVLAHKRKLRLHLRVRYRPAGGQAAAVTVSVRVKQPARHTTKKSSARRATVLAGVNRKAR